MGHTDEFLSVIRTKIEADDVPLKEARDRLHLVRDVAVSFVGALRTYASGSLAHHTMNGPVTDGDGGLVLDRRRYPRLGPEGGGETPAEVSDQLCAHLGPAVRETYPKARCGTSKRGPKISFGEPVDDQDPTVDLVVALTRREGNGLWIPNLRMNRWEASDPEGHAALFNSPPPSLRRTRRIVIRLLKAWNKQYSLPGMSSFHLSALAWEFVESRMGVPTALHTVLDKAATRVSRGAATLDPAGVSAPLKLLHDRGAVAVRLRKAAEAIAEAIVHDDDHELVHAALYKVFWKYLPEPADNGLSAMASLLRASQPVSTTALGLSGTPTLVVPTRAYGGQAPL